MRCCFKKPGKTKLREGKGCSAWHPVRGKVRTSAGKNHYSSRTITVAGEFQVKGINEGGKTPKKKKNWERGIKYGKRGRSLERSPFWERE